MAHTSVRRKPPCTRKDATAVLRRLREAGYEAYFAGGCVRDLLLGLEPTDWDVATSAPPARVRELFPRTQAVGQAFGVILVYQGRSVVEVATFRSEGDYRDGRRPGRVRFTTAQEDAARRDFTINGLFLDPLDGDRIIDFVGGREDLAARRLRAIGDPHERFREDHLRLLRAVRFAARFDLTVEEQTAAAIAAAAPMLTRISPERCGDELRLMLCPPSRAAAWRLLWKFGLLHVLFRFLPVPADVRLREARSPMMHLAPGREAPFGLALAAGVLCAHASAGAREDELLAAMARDRATHAVRAMRRALRISNEESDDMSGALEGLAPLLSEPPPRVAVLRRFLAGPAAGLSRVLMEALHSAGFFRQRIEWLRAELSRWATALPLPAPLINGDDLKDAGLSPGPLFKRILDAVYDAQLEGRVCDHDAALHLAMSLAREERSV